MSGCVKTKVLLFANAMRILGFVAMALAGTLAFRFVLVPLALDVCQPVVTRGSVRARRRQDSLMGQPDAHGRHLGLGFLGRKVR